MKKVTIMGRVRGPRSFDAAMKKLGESECFQPSFLFQGFSVWDLESQEAIGSSEEPLLLFVGDRFAQDVPCAALSVCVGYSSMRPNFARISDAAVQASQPQYFAPCDLRSSCLSSIWAAASAPNFSTAKELCANAIF